MKAIAIGVLVVVGLANAWAAWVIRLRYPDGQVWKLNVAAAVFVAIVGTYAVWTI